MSGLWCGNAKAGFARNARPRLSGHFALIRPEVGSEQAVQRQGRGGRTGDVLDGRAGDVADDAEAIDVALDVADLARCDLRDGG